MKEDLVDMEEVSEESTINLSGSSELRKRRARNQRMVRAGRR